MTLRFRDRRGTDCEKWDALEEHFGRKDLIAAWVADMDFESPDCVKDALRDYIEVNSYGYYRVPDEYYQVFIDWERKYHGYEVKKEWLRFIPGVVPGIYWLVQMWTDEGDGVLVTPPVYYPFMNSVMDTGRRLVECPLKDNNGRYEFDLELFEKKLDEEKVKVFILCNPHNPVGRVWSRDELKAVLDVCKSHCVHVIADEIHQDLIMPGYTKTTAAATGDYDDILVTLTAASKSFNIAGFQNAFAIIADESIRADFDKLAKRVRLDHGSAPGYIAVRAAYENGREWLEELTAQVASNFKLLKTRLEAGIPDARVSELEGTYLAWVKLPREGEESVGEIAASECGVACDFGEWFGGDACRSFLRVNLATSSEMVGEIAERLVGYFGGFGQKSRH